MTLKMQREDTVSGFSFLFPARYSPVEDAICPAGQPRGAGAGSVAGGQPVELRKSPRELGILVPLGRRWRLWLLPRQKSPLALPLPTADIAGMSNPSGCGSAWDAQVARHGKRQNELYKYRGREQQRLNLAPKSRWKVFLRLIGQFTSF